MVTPASIHPHSHIPAEMSQMEPSSNGGRLVSTDGRELPLQKSSLTVEAQGGLARVVLEQVFENTFDVPLHVRYQLPLPSDGAVSGFSFRLGGKKIIGEIDRKQRARERFEEALATGRSAALLEQTRSSLFQQEVGNVPPRDRVVCEVVIDQPLRWLAEGASEASSGTQFREGERADSLRASFAGWEWRFPTVVGPRYLGAKNRVADAPAVMVAVADQPLSHRLSLSLSVRDVLTGSFESPSHDLVVDREGCVSFASGVRLDRDVVIRWPVAKPAVGLSLNAARPSNQAHRGDAFGLLTLVPPLREAPIAPLPRDLIVLMDTSGSMDGRPLQQLQRVVLALIDSLGDKDRLELIEFSSSPRRWHKEPIVATRDGKREASKWVQNLRAGGGTEMRAAISEAISPLRADSQRQIVLITDGYIGFENEIVEEIVEHLPRGTRLHTVGVGSSVNRSLTGPAARAGAGVELIIGLEEDAERVVHRLIERVAAPIVTELEIIGEALLDYAPRHLPDLYRGAPSRIALRLHPIGGEVRVRGKMYGETFDMKVRAPALSLGEGNQAIACLFGREQVEDLETRRAFSQHAEIDREVEKIGLNFQISTRLTSWIAVTEQVTVDVSQGKKSVLQPHELPHGVSVEGLGLRAPQPSLTSTRAGVLKPGAFGSIELKKEAAIGGEEDEEMDALSQGADFDDDAAFEPEITGAAALPKGGAAKDRGVLRRLRKADEGGGGAPQAPAPASAPAKTPPKPRAQRAEEEVEKTRGKRAVEPPSERKLAAPADRLRSRAAPPAPSSAKAAGPISADDAQEMEEAGESLELAASIGTPVPELDVSVGAAPIAAPKTVSTPEPQPEELLELSIAEEPQAAPARAMKPKAPVGIPSQSAAPLSVESAKKAEKPAQKPSIRLILVLLLLLGLTALVIWLWRFRGV